TKGTVQTSQGSAVGNIAPTRFRGGSPPPNERNARRRQYGWRRKRRRRRTRTKSGAASQTHQNRTFEAAPKSRSTWLLPPPTLPVRTTCLVKKTDGPIVRTTCLVKKTDGPID
ncbi:unnamed protein product, partial [Ectocarpus sp. 4 AP-2014]